MERQNVPSMARETVPTMGRPVVPMATTAPNYLVVELSNLVSITHTQYGYDFKFPTSKECRQLWKELGVRQEPSDEDIDTSQEHFWTAIWPNLEPNLEKIRVASELKLKTAILAALPQPRLRG